MTTGSFLMRPAKPDEAEVVLNLLYRRAEWLASRGSDQWSNTTKWPQAIESAIGNRHTWLLLGVDQVPCATITLSTVGDPDFWTPEELRAPAVYLSKLATNLSIRRNLGALTLQWAIDMAFQLGHHPVRLDAWKTAAGLHRWYEQHGWTKLRIQEVPGRNSGALFEHPAQPGIVPEFATVPEPIGTRVLFGDDE
jgi:hypothetical protein